MTSDEIKELNLTPIDWCYNCARGGCKTSKQHMFAWIVCFLMRSDNSSYTFTKDSSSFTFIVDTNYVLNENEAIKKELYKKKNWKFLSEIVYKHVMDCNAISSDVRVTMDRVKALTKPKIKIIDKKVLVSFNC